jgi:hypothetical protein
MHWKRALLMAALSAMLAPAVRADAAKNEQTGKPDLKSAGPLAFGARGILFIGDPKGAAIFAVDTKDTAAEHKASINVENIKQTIASLLGTGPDQIRIQDVAVNPASGKVYLSVSRGRGPDAQPVILRVDAAGKISEFSLDNVAYSKAVLPNPPKDQESGSGRRRQNGRDFAITDLAYVDGTVIVAGLSNEEFSSNLRSIPYPFNEVNNGASIEIGWKRARPCGRSCPSPLTAIRKLSPPTRARRSSAFRWPISARGPKSAARPSRNSATAISRSTSLPTTRTARISCCSPMRSAA